MRLLDTSILIENMKKGIFEAGSISIVTVIEVLRGIKPEKRNRVKKLLEESFEVLPLNNEVILKYCELYDYFKLRGIPISDADLLIAATAIANNVALITKDSNFERMAEIGLKFEVRKS